MTKEGMGDEAMKKSLFYRAKKMPPSAQIMLLFAVEGVFLQYITSINGFGLNLYATNMGATDSQIGIIQMVPNIVACAALLPLGILADRLKSTKTIPMLTLLVMCAGYAFLGSVPALGERCMELFFVSLAFTAGALAIYNAQWQAMFGAAVSLRQRNDVYAFRNQFMFVIGILAPVICGMYVRSVEDCYYIGLFSYLSSGSISNVNIEKGFLYVKDSGIDAGGLVGDALGNVKVENCSVDIDACSEVTNGTDQVGGIVGYCQNGVVITGCTFHGDISYQDSHGIFGGICGTASKSSIINCETTGSVRVRDGQEFPFFEGGGICGRADNTKIDRCINRMDMSGRFYELGGICAIQTIGKISISHKNSETTYENGSVEITDCINYGNLQADTKDGVVGGIVGEVYTRDFQADNLKIENCENYADITGKTTIGGIIGELDIGAIKYSIRNCRNDGNVTAENWSGGIIGKLFSTVEGSKISGCTNNGQVTAGAPNGGIIGAYWGFTLGFKESSRGTLYIH